MRAISESRFWDVYRPLPDPGGNDHIWDYKPTLNYPLNQVWTLIEGEDNYRNLYACPGYHIVNVIGYCVTEKPWTDPTRDAMYFSA